MKLSCPKIFKSFNFIFSLFLILFASFLFLAPRSAFAVTKEEALSKYERVIVKSNQMSIYGYDLKDVAFKLKRMTEVLLKNRFDEADKLLDDIAQELEIIQTKGPEQMRREKKLVWLEIFGDFVQELALFGVITFFLIRFSFLKKSMFLKKPNRNQHLKLVFAFCFASAFGALLGLIRYGQSSWSFVDLQILFVGISGLTGGFWVGLIVGLVNSLFRLLIARGINLAMTLPALAGLLAGVFHFLNSRRPFKPVDILGAGFGIGLLHSLFTYIPMYRYLSFIPFLISVCSLTIAESGIIFLFFVLCWQILKEEKRKQTERELLRTRLNFLRAQINPHFLFNALNTIVAVCGQEGANRARRLIVQLSTFFRRITKEEGDFVPLQEELDYLDAYLSIEQARFGERLQVEKKIQLSESGLQTLVPILVLQPIVENAVKHGLSQKTEGGKIIIRAEEEDAKVRIDIEDTGVGMSEEVRQGILGQNGRNLKEINSDHAGVGLKNIRERMNNLFGGKFEMSITSIPNQGTTVSITLPKSA